MKKESNVKPGKIKRPVPPPNPPKAYSPEEYALRNIVEDQNRQIQHFKQWMHNAKEEIVDLIEENYRLKRFVNGGEYFAYYGFNPKERK